MSATWCFFNWSSDHSPPVCFFILTYRGVYVRVRLVVCFLRVLPNIYANVPMKLLVQLIPCTARYAHVYFSDMLSVTHP